MLPLACLLVYGILHLLTRDLLMQWELSHQHEPRETHDLVQRRHGRTQAVVLS